MSGNQNWRTPPALFELLNSEFNFTMDGAASGDDSLCGGSFLSDGHFGEGCGSAGWCALCFHRGCPELFGGRRIFVNPPYHKLLPWVEVFAEWRDLGATVAALLPAKPDTEWFHLAATTANEIRVMKGRVQFIDPATGKPSKESGNNAGSLLIVWRPGPRPGYPLIWPWDWRQ